MDKRIEEAKNRYKRLQERKLKLDSQIEIEKGKLKRMEHKARTKKLIEIGALAEKAEIDHYPHEMLLGAMIQIAHLLQDEESSTVLMNKGKELLSGKK